MKGYTNKPENVSLTITAGQHFMDTINRPKVSTKQSYGFFYTNILL